MFRILGKSILGSAKYENYINGFSVSFDIAWIIFYGFLVLFLFIMIYGIFFTCLILFFYKKVLADILYS